MLEKKVMKEIDIVGENHFEKWTKNRTACRGIVIRDGKILVTYETKNDGQLMIPGGGLEENETEKECVVRELAEETGFIVDADECVLVINEYYEEWKFVSRYYVCKIKGKTQKKLTEREEEFGLEIRWLPVDEGVEAFSKYENYASTDEMRRGLYLREYTALNEILPLVNKVESILDSIVDEKGIVIRWPTKKSEKLAVLEYLQTKFEKGIKYSEKQVNEILNTWHSFGDFALLRREMYDHFLIERAPDNSSYWIEMD